MNILITSAGRRVSLLRAFQKELKKINPKSQVFASDMNPELSGACQIADSYFEVPRLNDSDYITVLIEQCKANNIGLIIPTIDTELAILADNVALLAENNIQAVISSTDFISKCRDKRVIHDFFESKGIAIAKEYSKDNYTLPMFIKPSDGSRSVDTYLIRSKEELTDYHFQNEKLMFLQYIDHDEFEEYTCDLYYDKNGNLKCIVPRKRIVVRDGEVNTGVTEKNELVAYIKNHLNHIEGAKGCLTAQFFKHKSESEIYGIEINPRFGGGYPLSYLAGANYPKWILEEYILNQEIKDDFDCWEDNLLMIRYDDEILVHGYQN
ncbi:ATP-grasp domain-containing protein [Aurantibacter crassamenti]|uniref:ATP-grasp domain-containing protein n=1 Tax=Aurantibacter crassamenti TaxID=1837375 RepID=UPI001939C906|nr:ATP-grasp domain-containing protein [Aurantibacter crassamenti]MBM1106756.1 ATP-grasp domain-containing protein [Aurantibacter crassamenti]